LAPNFRWIERSHSAASISISKVQSGQLAARWTATLKVSFGRSYPPFNSEHFSLPLWLLLAVSNQSPLAASENPNLTASRTVPPEKFAIPSLNQSIRQHKLENYASQPIVSERNKKNRTKNVKSGGFERT
jgi:hypothetical protein